MRIVFIGAVELSRHALIRLLELGANVVGVCTLERSTVNADHADLSPIATAAGIPCRYAPAINSPESLDWVARLRPDVIFCFGWSRLLGTELLKLAPLGVVGFHPAALPANRGRHPLVWALALGLEQTASTFFFMDEGADTGDILSQRSVFIEPTDDAASLYERVVRIALEQIEVFLPQLASGDYPRVPQDQTRANSWRKRGRTDGQIDWRMSSRGIHNLVRALARPYVGAHFNHLGREIKLWRSVIVPEVPSNAEPGKVVGVGATGATVKCGEHGILLLETDPPFLPTLGEYL